MAFKDGKQSGLAILMYIYGLVLNHYYHIDEFLPLMDDTLDGGQRSHKCHQHYYQTEFDHKEHTQVSKNRKRDNYENRTHDLIANTQETILHVHTEVIAKSPKKAAKPSTDPLAATTTLFISTPFVFTRWVISIILN